jgi:hypothetical protein
LAARRRDGRIELDFPAIPLAEASLPDDALAALGLTPAMSSARLAVTTGISSSNSMERKRYAMHSLILNGCGAQSRPA